MTDWRERSKEKSIGYTPVFFAVIDCMQGSKKMIIREPK